MVIKKILGDIASFSFWSDTEERIVWKYIFDEKYWTSSRNKLNFNWDEAIKKLQSEEDDDLYLA